MQSLNKDLVTSKTLSNSADDMVWKGASFQPLGPVESPHKKPPERSHPD